jgi:hypothetical protein
VILFDSTARTVSIDSSFDERGPKLAIWIEFSLFPKTVINVPGMKTTPGEVE